MIKQVSKCGNYDHPHTHVVLWDGRELCKYAYKKPRLTA